MKTERRWLTSVLAAAAQPQPAMPWERGQRRRPAAFADRPAFAAPKAALSAAVLPPRPALAAR